MGINARAKGGNDVLNQKVEDKVQADRHTHEEIGFVWQNDQMRRSPGRPFAELVTKEDDVDAGVERGIEQERTFRCIAEIVDHDQRLVGGHCR